MSDIAIKVENLSKRYRIGLKDELPETLVGAATNFLRTPFQNLRQLRRLTRFTGNGDAPEDVIWALKDVSFEVERGEVVGIIGRNGAGKSTLLKILSRITHPTSGRVELNGRVSSLLEVGTGFHSELTGRENIYLNGTILGMTKAEVDRKFDEIVAFSGVEKFIDTPVKRYSSGMRMRLAFSVAAHLDPEIMLIDEVLAVGDIEFQRKCLNKMDDVSKAGRTVLFVSHNMASILNLCQRVILLESGHIAMHGYADRLVKHYLNQGAEAGGCIFLTQKEGGDTDDFAFRAIRVLNLDAVVTDQVSLDTGFDLEITYEINNILRGFNIAFHLFNDMGICIFSSTNIDQDTSSILRSHNPGLYRTKVHVPSKYLRAGRYYISVSSSIPNVQIFANLHKILSFDVIDTGSVESKISQGRQGVIAPILKWNTEYVGIV
jgi:lipopolysaccharide transport system ATP-binding protein